MTGDHVYDDVSADPFGPLPQDARSMSSPITYRQMEPLDVGAVSRLILDTFTAFIADEYSDEGRAEFTRYVQPEALVARARANHFVLVAAVGDQIAGAIEIRDNDHVALMFVDRGFQRRGIARELLQRAIGIARPAKPGLDRVTVNSSRFGVPAYEKLGFRQTGPERTVNGIVFIPMAHGLATLGETPRRSETDDPRPDARD